MTEQQIWILVILILYMAAMVGVDFSFRASLPAEGELAATEEKGDEE